MTRAKVAPRNSKTDALGPLEGDVLNLNSLVLLRRHPGSSHIYSVATSAKQPGSAGEPLGSKAKSTACW